MRSFFVITGGRRIAIALFAVSVSLTASAQSIDFSHATIVTSTLNRQVLQKPIAVLIEEVYKRTGITLVQKDMEKSLSTQDR